MNVKYQNAGQFFDQYLLRNNPTASVFRLLYHSYSGSTPYHITFILAIAPPFQIYDVHTL
jgi:hypothetical protein